MRDTNSRLRTEPDVMYKRSQLFTQITETETLL